MMRLAFGTLTLLLTLFVVTLPPARFAQAAEKSPPNVLFIAVDDLNDWIGCLGGHPDTKSPNISKRNVKTASSLGGHPDTKSPNIDRLAARGVLFERAYCAAPACNPSRAALLTGIAPYKSGVYLNGQPWRPAMPDAVTLPQLYMKHGYAVWGCGKIFHGRYPDPKSWQEYLPQRGDPQPKQRPVNGIPGTRHFDWGPVPVKSKAMSDHQMVDWAIEKLRSKHDKPFFLACGIYRPHLPWYVPQKYFDMYPLEKVTLPKVKTDDLKDIPPAGRRMARPERDHAKVTRHNQWKQAVQGYLASVTFADDQVGRLLDALDKSPHADNTIIVLWGDHGWHLGEKLAWRKFTLWEEADRAPLMMVVPGMTKSGGRCRRAVSFMDIYPTLAELCGLPRGDHLDGVSLRPLVENPAAARDRPAITTHGRLNHAARSERFRYIRYADGSEELYDHETDPYEWTNLADDPKFAERKKQLAAWLPKENAANAKRGK